MSTSRDELSRERQHPTFRMSTSRYQLCREDDILLSINYLGMTTYYFQAVDIPKSIISGRRHRERQHPTFRMSTPRDQLCREDDIILSINYLGMTTYYFQDVDILRNMSSHVYVILR